MAGKTLTSSPANGGWNIKKTPQTSGIGEQSATDTDSGNQSQGAITTWQIRHGITDAAKERGKAYATQANNRAFAPRRLAAENDLQTDGRAQAAAYIQRLKAKKR